MADDIAIQMRLEYTSNLVPGLQKDEAALKQFSAQAQAAGAKVAAQAEAATASTTRMGETTASSLAKIDPSVKQAVSGLSSLGLVIGGASVAADYFAVKSAVNFQRSMEMIHTQAGASQAEVESMTKAVMDMAVSVGTGPQQLADALYHIESAGLRGAQALQVLQAAAEGAKIGNANLEAVTQALIGATVSHIAGVQNEVQAMAELNAIVGTGDVRMQDLAQALSTGILPAANVVGLGLKDVGAALATMTDNAVPAEEAATRLRMTFSLMAAPSQAAQKALSSIGLSSTQLATDMRQNNGLLVALEDLKKHLEDSGKTAEQQEQVIARAFGGGRSSSAIETLLTELDRLKSKYEEQAKLVGQFGEEWQKTQQTAAFQFSQLRAAVETLGITLGAALLPSLQTIAKDLIPVTQGIQQVAAAAPGAVTAISALGAGILAVSLAMKGAMAVADPWVALVNLARKSNADAADSSKAAAAGIAEEGAAAKAATTPMQQFAAFLGMTAEEQASLAATGPEAAASLAAMSTETEAAATSTGLLSGALDVLLGPLGLVLLAATLGIITAEKSPAFRSEVNQAANALETKLKGASDIAIAGLGQLGNAMDWVNGKLDQGGTEAGKQSDKWQKLGDIMHVAFHGVIDPLSALGHQLDVEAAQHDKAAAAAQRQADVLKSLGLTAKQVQGNYSDTGGAAFGGKSGLDKPTNDNSSISAQVKYFNSEGSNSFDQATKQAAADLKAYALAVVSGSDAEKKLFQQAVGSSQYAKQLGDNLQAGTIKVDAAIGDFAGALQSTSKIVDGKYQDSVAQLALAIYNHTGSIQQLTQASVKSAQDEQRLSDAKTQAAKLIDKAAGTELDASGKVVKSATAVSDAFATLTSNLKKEADASLGVLTMALVKHSGNIDKLTAIAAGHASILANVNAKEEQARLDVARKLGDWATVIQIEGDQLKKAYDNAVDKLQYDQSHGASVSTIASDKSNVSRTGKAYTDFENSLKKAGQASDNAAKSFSDLQQAADTKAKAALEAYALGLMNGSKDIGSLRQAAFDAAGQSAKFAKALEDAKASIAGAAKSFSDLQSVADTKAKNALDALALGIMDGAKNLPKLRDAAVAAALGSDKFTQALAKATQQVAENSKDPAVQLKAKQDEAQHKYDEALAQVTLDIKSHGVATQAHEKALIAARVAVDAFTAAAKKAAQDALPNTFANREAAAKTQADKDQQALTRAIYGGASQSTIEDLAAKAEKSAAALQKYTEAHTKAAQMISDALARINPALLSFADNLSLANKAYASALDELESVILNGTGNQSALPGNHLPGRGPIDPDTGGSLVLTKMDQAIADLVTAYVNQKKVLDAQTEAQRIAAVQTGQWADVLKIDSDKIKSDLDNALDGLIEHFLHGTGDLGQLVSAYQQAYAAQQQLTDATIQAAAALGDWTTVVNEQKKQDQTTFEEALNKVLETIHNGGTPSEADIASLQAARQAQDAWTQATWDATYAASSAAEKSKLLSERFSGLISQANSLHSAEDAVFKANLQILSDQAQQQTRDLDSLVTLTQDETAIISAGAGLYKASAEGQITAVKDQTEIIRAQGELAKATTAAEKQVARDTLKQAQDQLAADRVNAQWSEIIARDNVQIAQRKEAIDVANQQAQRAVDAAKLQMDQDNLTLTEDQLALQQDTVGYLDIIASAFADVNTYGQQVQADLDKINQDQNSIAADELAYQQAQTAAAQIVAQGSLDMAQAQQQLAMDQAAADAASLQGQYRIAQDAMRVQMDQLAVQRQTASAVTQLANNSVQADAIIIQLLRDTLKGFLTGAAYQGRNITLNGAAAARAMTVDPMAFHSSNSLP